jgi:septum formation protein
VTGIISAEKTADRSEEKMASQIVLASASPRRSMLLKDAGIRFETAEAHISEEIPDGTDPRVASMYNALKKAQYVSAEYLGAFVVGADTIVYDGRIMGKPADEEDAFNMLSELRDRVHSVYTGVCIIRADEKITRLFCDRTDITFGAYSDEEIRDYISSGEPMDKAGSYAVQGEWSVHVEKIDGSRNNVIGLPVERLEEELTALGADTGTAVE